MPNQDTYTVKVEGKDGGLQSLLADYSKQLNNLQQQAQINVSGTIAGSPASLNNAAIPITMPGTHNAGGVAQASTVTTPPAQGTRIPLNIPPTVQHPQNAATQQAFNQGQATPPGYVPVGGNVYNNYNVNNYQYNQSGGNPNMPNGNGGYRVNLTPNGVRVGFRGSAAQALGLEAGYGAARVIGDGINYAAERALNGGDDITARYRLVASGASVGLGIAAGIATGNPIVGTAVAGISGAVLDPVARYLAAPAANYNTAQSLTSPFFGAYGGYGAAGLRERFLTSSGDSSGGMFGESAHSYRPSRLERLALAANSRLPGAMRFAVGSPDSAMAATFAGVSSGLFAGGYDPYQSSGVPFGTTISSPYKHMRGKFDRGNLRDSKFTLIDALVDVAGNAIINANRSKLAGGTETQAETITRRIATLFGKDGAAEIGKRQAKVYGSLPDVGNNVVDLLQAHGAEDTSTYLRLQNEEGVSSVDPMRLSRTSAAIRTGGRLARRAGTLARGSGAAAEQAISGEMSYVADLPDGRNSDLYSQLGAQRRQARTAKWAEEDYLNTGQKLVALNADAAIHDVLEYTPGYDMKVSLQRLGLRGREMATLNNRYTEGMKHPADFGIDQQQEIFGKYQNLRVQQAQDIATLAENGNDRAYLLAAGRGNSRMSYDSLGLAQTALWNVGANHIRKYGARDGRQMQAQENWTNQFSTPDFNAGSATLPHDRMSNFDNSAVVGLLTRLVNAVERPSGSMASTLHPGESRNSVVAALALTGALTGSPPSNTN